MKQNQGLAAVLAVALAFLGITYLPRGTPSPPPQTAGQTRPAPSPRPQEPAKVSSPCEEIQARLARLVAVTEPDLPDSCFTSEKPRPRCAAEKSCGKKTPPELRFAVAILPHPIATHLQLLFDREIEVIQQAAQDDGYAYEGSWLPWEDNPSDYALLADQTAAAEARKQQEAQPGILVFRRRLPEDPKASPYLAGLIVFLVADQPTHGINDTQFENALRWVANLRSPSRHEDLPVLGPTFSGSLPSLANALAKDRNETALAALKRFNVASGTVSSGEIYRWFVKYLKEGHLGEFQTYQEADELMTERFLKYLESEKFERKRVAFLSEDETAFGNTKATDDDGPVYLYYPRDIASLRSAYEQQSIFSSGKQAANPSAPGSTLRGVLSEGAAANQADTVRGYGGHLTPLAEESVLLDIAQVLSEKRIEFVIIRSTNTLDQIFLAQFLRRAYPFGRVVIDDADLLFHRGAEGNALRGVMTLSTYPLITREQEWTPTVAYPKNGSYRVFGEDLAEGTYIAARVLFGLDEKTQVPIHDYRLPAWAWASGDEAHPPTWVSVIGHRQYWPIAVLNGVNEPVPTIESILPGLDHERDGQRWPLAHLPLQLIFLLLFCLLWAGWHLFCCVRGSLLRMPRSLAYFAPNSGNEHKELVLLGSVLLVLLAILIFAFCGGLTGDLPGCGACLLALWSLLVLGSAAVGCLWNYGLPQPFGSADDTVRKATIRQWRLIAVLVLAAAAGFCFLWMVILTQFALTDANRIPAYWRSAHLLSGVSPLLPQVLLLAGWYGWFWYALQGLNLVGDDIPKLPAASHLHPWGRISEEASGREIAKAARPLSARFLLTLGISLALTVLVFGLALNGIALRSLGEKRFGAQIFFLLSFSLALILADSLQLLWIWSLFRRLLLGLDGLPLRRTLDALKEKAWGSIWKMSATSLEERYKVLSRQIESLLHLRAALALWVPATEKETDAKKKLLDVIAQCVEIRDRLAESVGNLLKDGGRTAGFLNPVVGLKQKLCELSGLAFQELLVPAWEKEGDSLLCDWSAGAAKSAGEQANAKPVVSGASPPHVRAAEEFFLLPYVWLIQNLLGRMRTIALGSLCIFVTTTLAMTSYPFDPLPVLGGLSLGVFVIAGGTLAYVYGGLHKDATLSHITNTNPGELGGQFWIQVLTFGIGPLVGLLTTLFPSLTDFLTTWLQPSVQAIK